MGLARFEALLQGNVTEFLRPSPKPLSLSGFADRLRKEQEALRSTHQGKIQLIFALDPYAERKTAIYGFTQDITGEMYRGDFFLPQIKHDPVEPVKGLGMFGNFIATRREQIRAQEALDAITQMGEKDRARLTVLDIATKLEDMSGVDVDEVLIMQLHKRNQDWLLVSRSDRMEKVKIARELGFLLEEKRQRRLF